MKQLSTIYVGIFETRNKYLLSFLHFEGNLLGAYFAFCAVVDGIQYKTGLGQNKKESKSNAAKLALDELLQLEEAEPKALENPGKAFILKHKWIFSLYNWNLRDGSNIAPTV